MTCFLLQKSTPENIVLAPNIITDTVVVPQKHEPQYTNIEPSPTKKLSLEKESLADIEPENSKIVSCKKVSSLILKAI